MTSNRAKVLFRAETSSAKISRPGAEGDSGIEKYSNILCSFEEYGKKKKINPFLKWRVDTYRQSRHRLCFHIQHRTQPSPPCPGIWRQLSRTGSSGDPSSSTLPKWTRAERRGCTWCTSPCRTAHRHRGISLETHTDHRWLYYWVRFFFFCFILLWG